MMFLNLGQEESLKKGRKTKESIDGTRTAQTVQMSKDVGTALTPTKHTLVSKTGGAVLHSHTRRE